MGSLPNLHELGTNKELVAVTSRHERPRQLLARAPTAPAQHQRVYKSKSNGHATNHVNDDLILDVSAYSPVSGRCVRSVRRRDSLSSSIGATSVRRLIGAVGRGGMRLGRITGSERRRTARALLALCGAHAASGAAVLPFLALQAGGGAWAPPWGPPLTSLLFLCSSITAPLGPFLVRHFSPTPPLLVYYFTLSVFFLGHLLPQPVVLLPLYLALGLTVGPAAVARSAALLHIASRIAGGTSAEDEEQRQQRRTTVLRRAARGVHFAGDAGLIIGSALAASILSFTLTPYSIDQFTNQTLYSNQSSNLSNLSTLTNCSLYYPSNSTLCPSPTDYDPWTDPPAQFAVDDSGERVCGARACPRAVSSEGVLSTVHADVLAGVFAGLALLGLLGVVTYAALRGGEMEGRLGPPAIRAMLDTYKDFRLQLAAPMSVFIGMEQAFMFTDFTKSYVICTLGITRVPLVFLSQGLLQSIAAATLSMLLRSIQRRRCLVVAVGLAFHACLLLVQLVWKPSADDPALLYVISAAWGVCHAIWEQLTWTLLTGAYGENTPAAVAAIANSQAWRFLGTSIVFGVHGLLCVRAQLHALSAALLLAAIPAAALEQRLHNLRKLRSISRL